MGARDEGRNSFTNFIESTNQKELDFAGNPDAATGERRSRKLNKKRKNWFIEKSGQAYNNIRFNHGARPLLQ